MQELTKSEPGEEEYSSILVNGVKNRNRPSFEVDWVNLW
jgi:hypothetical protein